MWLAPGSAWSSKYAGETGTLCEVLDPNISSRKLNLAQTLRSPSVQIISQGLQSNSLVWLHLCAKWHGWIHVSGRNGPDQTIPHRTTTTPPEPTVKTV